MTSQERTLLPAAYPADPMGLRLRSGALFAAIASVWAIALGILIGWGSYFVTGTGFWQVLGLLAVSTFIGGFASHLIFDGRRGLVRTILASASTPILATLAGAALSGWGALLPAALNGFGNIGLLFATPGAVYGLVYGLVFMFVRRKQGK